MLGRMPIHFLSQEDGSTRISLLMPSSAARSQGFDMTGFPEAMVLLDRDGEPPQSGEIIVVWSGAVVGSDRVSIAAAVDAEGLVLREEFLAWTHEFSRSTIAGVDIARLLSVFDNFSLWRYSVVAEHSPMKSPGIYRIFKLRALERMFERRGCRSLVYCGADVELDRILADWCRRTDLPYRWVRSRTTIQHRPSVRALVKRLPHWCQGVMFLAHFWLTRVRHAKRAAVIADSDAARPTTIVTYFPNLDLRMAKDGIFRSAYWGDLPDSLLADGVDWVLLYANSPRTSYLESIAIKRCLAEGAKGNRFFMLEDFVGIGTVFRVLGRFAVLSLSSLRLRGAAELFRLPGSRMNMAEVLRDEWLSSLFGKTAMEGLLYAYAFDNMARATVGARTGMFVWENQPWEHALLSAWRRHGNPRTVGNQHALLARLNVKYFADRRAYAKPSLADPLPCDILAVNGDGAKRMLIESGYPPARLAVTEALRYRHLKSGEVRCADAATLLVVTGYQESETAFQLALLNEAARAGALSRFRRILVKPHPFLHFDALRSRLALTFDHDVTTSPMNVLWNDTAVAFFSNSTSAVLEAVYVGVPAIICSAGDAMNLSPVYGEPWIPMVADGPSLAAALDAALEPPADIGSRFLHVADGVAEWKKILG